MAHGKGVTTQRAERLRVMLEQWWNGFTFVEIGIAHDICRQRAQRILASIGCTERHRRHRRQAHVPGQRDADRGEVTEAKSMMESAIWFRLTAKQRGVVAWLSMGLGMRAIAARTGGTPQSARNIFIAARWRALGEKNMRADNSDGDHESQFAEQEVDVESKNVVIPASNVPPPEAGASQAEIADELDAEFEVDNLTQDAEMVEVVPNEEFDGEDSRRERDAHEVPKPYDSKLKRIRLSDYQLKKPQVWCSMISMGCSGNSRTSHAGTIRPRVSAALS